MPDDPAWDGHDAPALARMLGVPFVSLHSSVGSTLDVAHALAEAGAPAGATVLAEEQTAGRGRGGKGWASDAGSGVWLTVIERPDDAAAVEVLSLRLGLAAAAVLDGPAGEPVRLKWPNDLYLAAGKLAGILVEARWRDGSLEWVAIGMGVNVRKPDGVAGAAGLQADVARVDVLAALVPAVRDAAAARGALTEAELEAWAARDLSLGRKCSAPATGRVLGIGAGGELRVATEGGVVTARSGSLVLQEEA